MITKRVGAWRRRGMGGFGGVVAVLAAWRRDLAAWRRDSGT